MILFTVDKTGYLQHDELESGPIEVYECRNNWPIGWVWPDAPKGHEDLGYALLAAEVGIGTGALKVEAPEEFTALVNSIMEEIRDRRLSE